MFAGFSSGHGTCAIKTLRRSFGRLAVECSDIGAAKS